MFLYPSLQEKVFNLIWSSKSGHYTGHDCISSNVFKSCADVFVMLLVHIIDCIFEMGCSQYVLNYLLYGPIKKQW